MSKYWFNGLFLLSMAVKVFTAEKYKNIFLDVLRKNMLRYKIFKTGGSTYFFFYFNKGSVLVRSATNFYILSN